MKKKILNEVKILAEDLLSEITSENTAVLKSKTARLYERLSILEYLESTISDSVSEEQPGLSESLDSKSYREKNWFSEPKPVPPSTYHDTLAEPVIEKIKDLVAEIPEDAQRVEKLLEEVLPAKKSLKNELEEFAADYQEMPVFERKENGVKKQESTNGEIKQKSLNDRLSKEITIGLNDRLAFIKHLFNGNSEDYARVLSQINTLSSMDEVEYFIKVKVKPDYNYWLNKEEFANRFMALIERKFI